MKTEKEIIKKVRTLHLDLQVACSKHASLHQIDMLSGEGNKLRELRSNLTGQINALNWVRSDWDEIKKGLDYE